MPLQIKSGGAEVLSIISEVFHASGSPLLHAGQTYIRFLLACLPRAQLHCLIATDGSKPIGYLPLISQTATDGRVVVNSLPFFGSHGGPVVRADAIETTEIAGALLRSAMELAESLKAVSVTVVENPFLPIDLTTAACCGLSVVDDRIGQLTPLPTKRDAPPSALIDLFHAKTRNAIRKGQRLAQTFERRIDPIACNWLLREHERSIVRLGGVPKSQVVFESLFEMFPLGEDSRLYTGSIGGQLASGLLLLKSGTTIEYFTPVVADEYKNQQALSALVFYAMSDALREGFALWNWGGTWRTQQGVYRFKSRFGAVDYPYRYFHRLFDKSLLNEDPQKTRDAFPYFYTHRYTS